MRKHIDFIIKILLCVALVVPFFFILYLLLISNQRTLNVIFIVTFVIWLVLGVLIIVLTSIFGIKISPVKAEVLPLPFSTYDELLAFLQRRLFEKKYRLQEKISIFFSGELLFYAKRSVGYDLLCYVMVRVPELSEEEMECAKESITNILSGVDAKIRITTLICVDRITPTFQEIVDSHTFQLTKVSRLPVGICFDDNTIHIAQLKDGWGIGLHRKLRKKFIALMDLDNQDITKQSEDGSVID